MNIDGLNSSGSVKITNSYTKKKSENFHSKPSFSGQILTQDNRGNDIYKFNLPNAPQGTKIQFAVLTKDKDGYFRSHQGTETYDMPKGFESYVVRASKFGLDENNILGYKFIVNGKEYTDKGVKGDKNFTLAVPVTNANSARPRQMEHVLVDSFNVPNPAAHKRNHFNMLGGTLNSVYEKLPEFKEFGIRNILGTPIFGQDNKSSHGYWTTNPYQITDNLGNFKDFRNLMIGLYQNGMSWTADGAFVNEGMEGIHIKDIMNWGVESPFLAMFETKDLKNVPIRFGILSKNADVNKHIHIKLVNAPYKILFEKDGEYYKEAKVVRNSVDVSRPTYIQVFDDRLASEEQMNNDEIFNVYDNKEAKDKYEIANYKDSVQAYHFRVTPAAVQDNYKKYKEIKWHDKSVEFKQALTNWPHFSIVNSNKDGGVSLWVGNSDISKKRFVLPDSTLKSLKLSGDEKAQVIAAQYQVQDDTVQIGKFWTGEVARLLTEYTAKELSSKLGSARSADAYKAAIESLINENKLPEGAKELLEKEDGKASPLENILSYSPVSGKRKYQLKPVVMAENITDGIMSYPFDAIEFSPDLAGVLAYPFIKNLAVTEDTIGMSRYEMYQMGDEYYNKMPERYRKIYKETDNLLANEMTDAAVSILKSVEKETGRSFFCGDELNQEGKEIYTLLASDITKFLIVSSLAPEIKQQSNQNMLEYDVKELQKIDLNKLNLQYETSPEEVSEELIKKIKTGLENIPEDNKKAFVQHLASRVNSLNSDSINVAKLIIEKTESGLDWRIDAAKDVGDWEAQETGKFPYDANEKAINAFWNKFNSKGVKPYNPRRYAIGELTDWQIPKSQFVQRADFTTVSDYEYWYSTLPSIYGQNSDGKRDEGGSITKIFGKMFGDGGYFDSGTSDNFNFAHRFVGNQDKPRILHLLAMDVANFNKDKGKEVENVLIRGFEKTEEYKNLPEHHKQVIKNAITKLKKGEHTVDGQTKKFDPENFGVRPFDMTIADVIEEAAVESGSFRDYCLNNKETIEKLKANTLKNILEPAMKKYRSILFAMVGLPGTPTNYAGDEFGMTGWETFAKNEKQENRNAIRWDWLNNENYKFIKDYRDELSYVMKIRNKEAASALVNGSTQPLHNQKINGGGEAVAFYRYNDKTDAVVVLHANGYDGNPEHCGIDAYLDEIKLDGLGFELPEGTMYSDALDRNKQYKVFSGNVIKRVDKDGNPSGNVELGNVGLILLRQKDFKGREMSFKGRIENPNVKLANTKYNLSYMKK